MRPSRSPTAAFPAVETEPFEHPEQWIGRVIDGRYRIVDELGVGAMGAVFEAEHLKLRKSVALKVILSEHIDNEELASRFAREAMATALLDHPHIVSALDYGALDEGGTYLVMQLVPGESLRARMQRGEAFAWGQACEVVAQIADALIAAHAAGIVHRDLKPENIMLQRGPAGSVRAKVLDFGIARVPTEDAENAVEGAAPGKPLTRVGLIMGTPGYMPPEQAMGELVDEGADLYALGVILWEMVAGCRLFRGNTDDMAALVGEQLTTRPPVLGNTPRELNELIQRMLVVDPGARLTSAAEAHAALGTLVMRSRQAPIGAPKPAGASLDATSRDVRARVETVISKGAEKAQAGVELAQTRLGALSPRHRLLSVLFGIGLIGVVSLAGLVILFALASGEETPAASTTPPTLPNTPPTVVPDSRTPAPPAQNVQDTPAAQDPWDAPVPSELARIRTRLSAGRPVGRDADRTLRSYASRHRDDPRPHLLTARLYLSRRWRADAIREYERAYERDVTARGDPNMLADLVALVPHRTAGAGAARAIGEIYGSEALGAVERARGEHAGDADAVARYEALSDALRDSGARRSD